MSDDAQKREPGIPGIVSFLVFVVLFMITMMKEVDGEDNFGWYILTGVSLMVMVTLTFIHPIG